MQCHVIILDTTGTTYTFYMIEKRKESKKTKTITGALANRTYGVDKNQYIDPFLLTIFGPVNYGPP